MGVFKKKLLSYSFIRGPMMVRSLQTSNKARKQVYVCNLQAKLRPLIGH